MCVGNLPQTRVHTQRLCAQLLARTCAPQTPPKPTQTTSRFGGCKNYVFYNRKWPWCAARCGEINISEASQKPANKNVHFAAEWGPSGPFFTVKTHCFC